MGLSVDSAEELELLEEVVAEVALVKALLETPPVEVVVDVTT